VFLQSRERSSTKKLQSQPHEIPNRSVFINAGIFAILPDNFGFPPELEPGAMTHVEASAAITTFSKNPEGKKLPEEQNQQVPVGSWG